MSVTCGSSSLLATISALLYTSGPSYGDKGDLAVSKNGLRTVCMIYSPLAYMRYFKQWLNMQKESSFSPNLSWNNSNETSLSITVFRFHVSIRGLCCHKRHTPLLCHATIAGDINKFGIQFAKSNFSLSKVMRWTRLGSNDWPIHHAGDQSS